MKKSTIALSLIAMLLALGCSDKEKAKPEAAPASAAMPAAPAASAAALTKEAPGAMRDLPNEQVNSCAVDVINNMPINQTVEEVAVNRADGLKLDGWAFDEKIATVLPEIAVQLTKGDDRFYATATRHSGRDDLAKGTGKPDFLNAGFSASVDIASLPPGEYELIFLQKAEGKNLACSTKHKLVLKA